jgi:RNA polymerase sigma factor (sigma-70 family)
MAGISDFLRYIVVSELRGESDAELLRRFLVHRDEAAFTAIVRRHGAMVYYVCRGVLRNEADAEDACQAVFLVLAQKAAQVRKLGSLASWLHGVALRTSRKLLASIARRRAGEARLPPPPSSAPQDMSVREAGLLLHEELERLPARYKDPLVLCYLQGKTHDEAAAALGWTLTVFRGRLERARKQLHGRLKQRGVALTTALLTGVLIEARPSLATTFAMATARAAACGPLTAASRGLISPLIAQLTQEVPRTMSFSALKFVVALSAVMVLTTGGYFAYHTYSAQPAAPVVAESLEQNKGAAPKPQPGDMPGQILMSRYNRFARLGPNLDLVGASKELENEGEFIGQHRISPDGKSVAFKHQTVMGEVLSVWKFDQAWPGRVVRTREFIVDFFWMPDSKQLVLSKYQGIKNNLPADYKFQMLDVATRKFTDFKLPEDHWPTDVSADGKWFLTVKNVDPKNSAVGAELYRVERSNGKARKLFGGATIITPPKWRISPDGSQVAGVKLNDNRRLQIYVGDMRAGKLRQVTNEDHHLNNFFGWSPDSRKLLYQLHREPAAPRAGAAYHQILAAINADGRDRIELFDNECHYNAQAQRQVVDMILWADWR